MKRKFSSAVLVLALISGASGQTATFYVNDAVVTDAPQIDAYNFINNGTFSAGGNALPYETANTLAYTNRGLMESPAGFRFETFSTQTGLRQRASSFVNEATASINCGATLFWGLPLLLPASAKCIVSATNILNQGAINIVGDGLVSLKGDNIDLSRGLVNIQSGFDPSGGIGAIFDGYWGIGTNKNATPANFDLFFATTPRHWVTNRYYQALQQTLFLSPPTVYVSDQLTGPSNRLVQAAFLYNASPAFSNNVYFTPDNIEVEWIWSWTNLLTDAVVKNHMFLIDSFGSQTNLALVTNGVAAPNTGYGPAFIPTNYAFRFGGIAVGTPASPGLPDETFGTGKITNEYAAYEALFSASSIIPGDVANQTIETLPGRVEIVADKYLNLERARIGSLSYLRVDATNHVRSGANARMVSPFLSMNLHTTNGVLAITNMIPLAVPRLSGPVDLWSGRWTNVDTVITNDITNSITINYHVLFVNNQLAVSVPPLLDPLILRSTNVTISDLLNIQSNLLIEAESITITTNGPGAPNSAGQINILSGDILWPRTTPRLRCLTNNGIIRTYNAAFFGGSRTQPFFSTNFNEPYDAFVNRGSVYNEGSLIWAKYFENLGTFFPGGGSITLQSQVAVLTNGSFLADNGDITITSDSLRAGNHVLRAGRKLSLTATNLLTDGGVLSRNFWTAGSGFDLPIKPAAGDLLGTTVTDTAPTYREVVSQWAGEDRGCSAAGYTNNAALGCLILDGDYDSLFTFRGTGGNNAIYVDRLELKNYATNRNASGDFIGLQIEPGMKVYFAQALMNGQSIAETLNGRNDGRLCWIGSYAGFFSGTNVVYPDGSTNRLNAALVRSCSLDSDGDNIVNCADPSPVFVPSQFRFRAALTNTPARAVALSWQTIGSANNLVYVTTNLASPQWQLATNFVSPPFIGPPTPARLVVPAGAGEAYYRLRVDAPQP